MDMMRRLASFALVLFAVACVATWAAWFNPALDVVKLPMHAEDFPLGPFRGPLAFGFTSFLVAYLVYPPNKDARDDRR